MKKVQLRKYMVLLIIMTMMMTQYVFAADDFTIETDITELTGNGSISEGDVRVLKVKVTNATGGKIDTGITVSLSGSFTSSSGSDYSIASLDDGDDSGYISIPVTYSGSGNSFNIIVDDAKGNSSVQNITISNVTQTSTGGTSTPVDKDRLYAEFNILLGETVPAFSAGQTREFKFDLKNLTTYSAKNIKVELKRGAEAFPFDDRSNPIITPAVSMTNGELKSFTVSVKTDGNAESGFYKIPVRISFQNVYGLDKYYDKEIQVEVYNSKTAPAFTITEVKHNDPLTPDTSQTVMFRIKNVGTLNAKSVKATLDKLSVDGVTLDGDVAQKNIGLIDGIEDSIVTYKLHISDQVKTDRLELALNLTCYDEFGKTYNSTVPVYLDLEKTSVSLYDFDVKVTSQPSTIQPGDSFRVNFNVTNTSDTDRKDLEIKFESDGSFIHKSASVLQVKELLAGETKSYSYKLIAGKDMASNNYPSYIKVCKNSDEVKSYLGLYVDSEAGLKSKPKIIIDQYNYGGDTVLAGDTFDLEIVFFNTSSAVGIRNAKVSISSDESAFIPVNTASSFFIDSIGANEKVSHVITMKAKTDLSVKSYNVTADIEYEDSNGNSYDQQNNPYKATEHIAIPVAQELRLEVEELTVQPFGYVFNPIELYVEFFNMGKAPLNNMLVKTEGDFEIQDGKYFVGTFNPGTNDYYSCTIMPMNVGTNVGKVIFEFEDALGELHRVEKEFTIEASEMEQDFGEMDEFPDEFYDIDVIYDEYGNPIDPNEGGKLPIIIIILVIIVVIIVVIVIVRKRIQKKKEMALDE